MSNAFGGWRAECTIEDPIPKCAAPSKSITPRETMGYAGLSPVDRLE